MANTKDYQNGKIYTIRNHIDDEVYVGSTTQPLSKRMTAHRGAMKKETNYGRKVYKHMNELGIQHFYIELYESYPCNSCEELAKREGEVIREIGTLNKRIEGQTKKEYYEANREHRQEYYKANKSSIKDKIKEYQKANKGKISEYKKEYTKANKEKIKEYKQANKDKISVQRCTPFICECGRTVQTQQKARHCKSKVHQEWLSSQSTTDTSTDDNQ